MTRIYIVTRKYLFSEFAAKGQVSGLPWCPEYRECTLMCPRRVALSRTHSLALTAFLLTNIQMLKSNKTATVKRAS